VRGLSCTQRWALGCRSAGIYTDLQG